MSIYNSIICCALPLDKEKLWYILHTLCEIFFEIDYIPGLSYDTLAVKQALGCVPGLLLANGDSNRKGLAGWQGLSCGSYFYMPLCVVYLFESVIIALRRQRSLFRRSRPLRRSFPERGWIGRDDRSSE